MLVAYWSRNLNTGSVVQVQLLSLALPALAPQLCPLLCRHLWVAAVVTLLLPPLQVFA